MSTELENILTEKAAPLTQGNGATPEGTLTPSQRRNHTPFKTFSIWVFYGVFYAYLKWASGYGIITSSAGQYLLGLSPTVWMPAMGFVFGVLYTRPLINIIPFILAELCWQVVTGSPGAGSFNSTPAEIATRLFVLLMPPALFATICQRFFNDNPDAYPGNYLTRLCFAVAILMAPLYASLIHSIGHAGETDPEYFLILISTGIALSLGVFLFAPVGLITAKCIDNDNSAEKAQYISYLTENYKPALIPIALSFCIVAMAGFIEYSESINIFPLIVIPCALMLLRVTRSFDLFYFLTPVTTAIIIAFATLNELNLGDLPIYEIPGIQIVLISTTLFCFITHYLLHEARSRLILPVASKVSQAEVLSAVDQSNVGYIITDTAGVIVFCSKSGAQLLGAQHPSQLMNRAWIDIDQSSDGLRARRKAVWQNFVTTGQQWQGEVSWRLKNNNIKYFDAYGTKLDSNKIIIVLADSTAKVKAAKALRASEKLRNFILDSLPITITLQDNQNRLIYANKHFSTRIRHSLEDLIDQRPDQIKGYVRIKAIDRLLAQVRDTGVAIEDRTVQIDEGPLAGTEWLIFMLPLLDKHGDVAQVLSVGLDRTERRSLVREKELMTKRLYATQRIEALNKFAGGLAHELSNLLHPAGVYARAMNAEPDLENREQYLEKINDAVLEAGEILRSTLTMSRSEGFELKPHNVTEVVQGVFESAQKVAPKGLTYSFETQTNNIISFLDETELRQVLLNLLINAADAQGGTGNIAIQVTQERKAPSGENDNIPGPYARISVTDCGQGIEPETQKSMFDAFFTTKEPGKGTGLGLAMVQSIVTGWGGFITVDTKLGTGTTFHIWLPAAIENKVHNNGPDKHFGENTNPTKDTNQKDSGDTALPR